MIFDISAQMKYGDCYVYAAMYDENGVMIELTEYRFR